MDMRSLIVSILMLSFAFYGCEKPAGEGGTSSITGKVLVNEYNVNSILIAQYYSAREDVFIVYGNSIVYDDRMETHLDGTYEFKYLRKGSYQVFSYSDCDTCSSPRLAVLKDVEITDNNQQVTIEDIIIDKR